MVTNDRLLEILRGYIAANSDNVSLPDFHYEKHLLAIMQLAADEATAQAGGLGKEPVAAEIGMAMK